MAYLDNLKSDNLRERSIRNDGTFKFLWNDLSYCNSLNILKVFRCSIIYCISILLYIYMNLHIIYIYIYIKYRKVFKTLFLMERYGTF